MGTSFRLELVSPELFRSSPPHHVAEQRPRRHRVLPNLELAFGLQSHKHLLLCVAIAIDDCKDHFTPFLNGRRRKMLSCGP